MTHKSYNKNSLTKELAKSLKNKTKVRVDNLEEAIKKAYEEEMKKYKEKLLNKSQY